MSIARTKCKATARDKTAQNVLNAVVARLPRAMIPLAEIEGSLGLPVRDAVRLITQAESDGLIATWWTKQNIYCCLSASEAGHRSRWLRSPEQAYRAVKDHRTGETKYLWLSADKLAARCKWVSGSLRRGGHRDYQDADGEPMPYWEEEVPRPKIKYELQNDGSYVGIVVDWNPTVSEWGAVNDSWDAESARLAGGRGASMGDLIVHSIASDDPMDVSPDPEADSPGSVGKLKWPSRDLCPWLEKFSEWAGRRPPWPKWLRPYLDNPWPQPRMQWTVYLHVLQFARRTIPSHATGANPWPHRGEEWEDIFHLLNAARRDVGLRPLTWSRELVEAEIRRGIASWSKRS